MSQVAERRADLLALVAAAIAAHDDWVHHSSLESVAPEVDEAFSALVEEFSVGSIPGDCRVLAAKVEAFGREWTAWQAEVERTGRATTTPAESVWSAWESVVGAYQGTKLPPRRPIESVKLLHEQGCTPQQICRIYGWMDAHGQAETWKVEEELQQPGMHTKDWIDPITRQRQEAARKEQSLRDRVKAMRERKLQKLQEPCPESLEELVRLGVSLPQIALMMRRTPEEVLAACDAAGLARPADAPNLAAMRSDYEPPVAPEVERAYAAEQAHRAAVAEDGGDEAPLNLEGLTLEQRIVQCHLAGLEAKEIAAELSTAEEKVSTQKVTSVLKRYDKDPEAFAMPEG